MGLFVSPMAEEDGPILERAARLLVDGNLSGAQVEFAKLSPTDPIIRPKFPSLPGVAIPGAKRPNVSPAILAPILQRDCWCCRYCGRRLVVAGVLELLGIIAPNEFPFPRGHNMPAARTHVAACRTYPAVDHVRAGSSSNLWRDQNNLVAACMPCNESKGDRSGWIVQPVSQPNWTGLVQLYRPLMERATVRRQYHVSWLNALGTLSNDNF